MQKDGPIDDRMVWPRVAASSGEAELLAAVSASCDALGLVQMGKDLGLQYGVDSHGGLKPCHWEYPSLVKK